MKQLTDEERALITEIDQQGMLAAVELWADINSGTGHLPGLARMAEELSTAFSALPGEVSLIDPAPVTTIAADGQEVPRENGQHLVCRVRPDAPRRFLLTGHMDTVYPPDHPFQSITWLDDDTINGPGTADMKGGIAVILEALKAFERSPHAAEIGYDVMINSDEETGSLSSSALIHELAQGKYAALTYEPSARPEGTLAHARGGSGNYAVTVTGQSAHAGRNPQDGRNAIVAAADLAVRLKAAQHASISINPAKIDGGGANNVVPDHAVLRFNIRPKTTAAAEQFEKTLAQLITAIETEHDVSLSLHGGISRPPKPVDAQAEKLFALVRDVGAALGQNIDWQDTGGVCDGNNVAACGVPVIDTMGVRGGKIHSPQEFMIVPSLSERAALSAITLHRLASGALA
ncbi:hydrolase [Altericroceibacterium endophyticum]|uniref:Hydrolase n=1 Tax=Altericroceibacterium endophyticum TaxID=1808508 RepID=A0A6I4T7I2_9SPHN|nr:hydrolase [Altericroceibacterium endophyticum]MXO66787.1 hydrolase [Altericroceibacterium endophyticum]